MSRPLAFSMVIAFLVTGCQTWNAVQYNVPYEKTDQLKGGLTTFAEAHDMQVILDEPDPPTGPALYFRTGDMSFTELGMHRHYDRMIVNLRFRSAGIGGQTFDSIHPQLVEFLETLYEPHNVYSGKRRHNGWVYPDLSDMDNTPQTYYLNPLIYYNR